MSHTKVLGQKHLQTQFDYQVLLQTYFIMCKIMTKMNN